MTLHVHVPSGASQLYTPPVCARVLEHSSIWWSSEEITLFLTCFHFYTGILCCRNNFLCESEQINYCLNFSFVCFCNQLHTDGEQLITVIPAEGSEHPGWVEWTGGAGTGGTCCFVENPL